MVLDGCSLAVSAAAPREAPDFSPRSQKSVYGMGSHGGPNFTHKAASQRCDAYSLDRSQVPNFFIREQFWFLECLY